ncbi:peptidyl-prolyl cis-trans isomerase [Phenylobacterium sp. VNQ135]|uniref:peptidylprolyl isomerase n=1 Tax=Phenylobacterium sp. VNQ135 TaxID=3400922 RepID=UPI003C0887AD
MSKGDSVGEAMNGLSYSRQPEDEPAPGEATSASSGAVARLRRIAAEPLLHFVVAGLLLFLAGRVYQVHTDTHRIVVTPERVGQVAGQYAMQFGAQPDAATLEALVRADIKDEILFREGRALELDEGDEIVRRRVIQKMQFLMDDTRAPAEPTAIQLKAFYERHSGRYQSHPKATFSHIYFAPDPGGDAVTAARAQALLAAIPNGVTRAPDRGDPFPDLYDFSAADAAQVERLFGRTAFAEAVFQAPVGRWSGPYRSGYGWHLLYVNARQAPGPVPLEAVKDAVRADYLRDAQERANREAFDKLARRFTVIRADREARP